MLLLDCEYLAGFLYDHVPLSLGVELAVPAGPYARDARCPQRCCIHSIIANTYSV